MPNNAKSEKRPENENLSGFYSRDLYAGQKLDQAL